MELQGDSLPERHPRSSVQEHDQEQGAEGSPLRTKTPELHNESPIAQDIGGEPQLHSHPPSSISEPRNELPTAQDIGGQSRLHSRLPSSRPRPISHMGMYTPENERNVREFYEDECKAILELFDEDGCSLLAGLIRFFKNLLEHTHATIKGVNEVLELKQKQANLLEARFSRRSATKTAEQAETTANQGQVVLFFTVVTIIFGSLSFMTAFMALSVQAFPQETTVANCESKRSDSPVWALGKVTGLFLGLSTGLSAPLILCAFKINTVLKGWPWNADGEAQEHQTRSNAARGRSAANQGGKKSRGGRSEATEQLGPSHDPVYREMNLGQESVDSRSSEESLMTNETDTIDPRERITQRIKRVSYYDY